MKCAFFYLKLYLLLSIFQQTLAIAKLKNEFYKNCQGFFFLSLLETFSKLSYTISTFSTNDSFYCNLTKDTEWEITKTKTKVGNKVEIIITLTKYNTCQWCEEDNCS